MGQLLIGFEVVGIGSGLHNRGLASGLGWENCSLQTAKEEDVLAIAGTGYGVIGILVIILLVVLILYFVRRA